ncbi:hypothetical protein I7I48_05810 [Histoplasma ohiense]|nr:hypothetical protein I7I48_05810 [Histoplasma ohiense (nom. inval.)]
MQNHMRGKKKLTELPHPQPHHHQKKKKKKKKIEMKERILYPPPMRLIKQFQQILHRDYKRPPLLSRLLIAINLNPINLQYNLHHRRLTELAVLDIPRLLVPRWMLDEFAK